MLFRKDQIACYSLNLDESTRFLCKVDNRGNVLMHLINDSSDKTLPVTTAQVDWLIYSDQMPKGTFQMLKVTGKGDGSADLKLLETEYETFTLSQKAFSALKRTVQDFYSDLYTVAPYLIEPDHKRIITDEKLLERVIQVYLAIELNKSMGKNCSKCYRDLIGRDDDNQQQQSTKNAEITENPELDENACCVEGALCNLFGADHDVLCIRHNLKRKVSELRNIVFVQETSSPTIYESKFPSSMLDRKRMSY